MRRKQILKELKLDEFLRIFQENSADQFFVRLCGYVCVCVCVLRYFSEDPTHSPPSRNLLALPIAPVECSWVCQRCFISEKVIGTPRIDSLFHCTSALQCSCNSSSLWLLWPLPLSMVSSLPDLWDLRWGEQPPSWAWISKWQWQWVRLFLLWTEFLYLSNILHILMNT